MTNSTKTKTPALDKSIQLVKDLPIGDNPSEKAMAELAILKERDAELARIEDILARRLPTDDTTSSTSAKVLNCVSVIKQLTETSATEKARRVKGEAAWDDAKEVLLRYAPMRNSDLLLNEWLKKWG